jgi:hypothetical protein
MYKILYYNIRRIVNDYKFNTNIDSILEYLNNKRPTQ